MNFERIVVMTSLLAPLVLIAPGVPADESHEHDHENEHRQHDAHVHGIAALNLALEGRQVHLELDSPAANIVGFEHAPSSDADHAALDRVVAMLKEGNQLFRFNAEAGCLMEKVAVTSSFLEGEHEEHEHEEHEHEEHEHEGETHSDIEATYLFECDHSGKLTGLTVKLFEAFPGTEKLIVQFVIEEKQGAAELTPSNHVVKF